MTIHKIKYEHINNCDFYIVLYRKK